MSANDKQVGGDHYKEAGRTGEEHWDRVWRLKMNYWQAAATKYIERYPYKNGKQDLLKAIHYIEKLIELEYPEEKTTPAIPAVGEKGPEYDWPPLMNSGPIPVRGVEGIADHIYPTILTADEARIVEHVKRQGCFISPGQVKPTGWTQFVFEGMDGQGVLYTCRHCKGKFYAPPADNPHDHHPCRNLADSAGAVDVEEPTKAYVNQG